MVWVVESSIPPDGSITEDKLADGAVTNVKVNAAASIALSKLADDVATQAELDAHSAADLAVAHPTWVPTFQAGVGALNTPRENTSGRPILVFARVTIQCTEQIATQHDEGRVKALVENANPPTISRTATAFHMSDTGEAEDEKVEFSLSFVVPDGWFYELETETIVGGPTFALLGVTEVVL